MLLSSVKYGALSGKTRAMFGKLLKNRDYAEMMQKKSVNEIAAYLKYNTHFSSSLADIEEDSIHRGRLENILRRDYVNDFAKLMRFSAGGQREFINLLYLKSEIEGLKLLLRIFEAGNVDREPLEESLKFLARYGDLNIHKLSLARNLDELISGLKGTSYYEVMRPFVSASEDTRLFSLEMSLDTHYFRKVHESLEKLLHGRDREIGREFFGIETDVYNIFWIYRSKTYYQTDKELIYTYIAPSFHKIDRKIIDRLIDSKDFGEFYNVLQETQYGKIFTGSGPGVFEHHCGEFLYALHRRSFTRDMFSIACVISYLKLKEYEMNNIISIIEGIRYKLSPTEIRKFLVGVGFHS